MACSSCGKRTNPNILQLGRNAASALNRVAVALVKGKPVFTPEEMVRKRLKTCAFNECGYFRSNPAMRCVHPSCGCFLKAKTKLETEHCPVHLW